MSEAPRLRNWRTDLVMSIALGVAYYLAAQLSLRLALVGENITPLWPPTGIALVGFLLRGRRLWPGVAIAAFAVNLPISTSGVAAAVTAVGNTLAPLAAATLLLRVGFRPQLDRLRDALAIVFLAALGATIISATVGATTLLVSDAIEAREFWGAWSVWWAGDAMGILVVAPFLLTLTMIRSHPVPRGWKAVEAIALVARAGRDLDPHRRDGAPDPVPALPGAGVGSVAFPAARRGPRRPRRLAVRDLGGRGETGDLRRPDALGADVHAPGVQRHGRVHVLLLRGGRGRTPPIPAGARGSGGRPRGARRGAHDRTHDRERASGGVAGALASRFVGLGRGDGRRELVPTRCTGSTVCDPIPRSRSSASSSSRCPRIEPVSRRT